MSVTELIAEGDTEGLSELFEKHAAEAAESAGDRVPHDAADLAIPDFAVAICPQCRGTLHAPTTLLDGVTVCTTCAPKWTPTADAAFDAEVSQRIGYGGNSNHILSEVLTKCFPAATAAAKRRQEGTTLFKEREYVAAEAAYTQAIEQFPHDPTVLSNRSAVRLALDNPAGALDDATKAVALAPSWHKAHFRHGKALYRLDRPAEAAAALARSLYLLHRADSAKREQGSPQYTTDSAATQRELVAALERAVAAEDAETAISAALDSLGLSEPSVCDTALPVEMVTVPDDVIQGCRDDLDCCLCFQLLYRPTTLACGHMLCTPCLTRTLDHAFDREPVCPMCRHKLGPYLTELNREARRRAPTNRYSHGGQLVAETLTLTAFIASRLSEEHHGRAAEVAESEASEHHDGREIPLFICSVAMPGVECPLHVFEPRYRLMMRRCLESGHARFGMALGGDNMEYGTILDINHFEQLPDGRSLVKTVGSSRFRIVSLSERDGYSVASVEMFEDTEEDPGRDDNADPDGDDAYLERVARYLSSVAGDRLGEQPRNPRHLPFFVAAVCMDQQEHYALCYGEDTRTSHRERARRVRHRIAQLLPEETIAAHLGDGDTGGNSGECELL